MSVNGPGRLPLLSPDVGDVVFNLNMGDFQTIYRRMRVLKVTATQIVARDPMRREARYWRKDGREVGNRRNCLALVEPGPPAFEAKHQVGKPLPEVGA